MPLFPANGVRVVALALFLPFSVQSADLRDLGESSRSALTEIQEAQLGREIMRQIRADKAYLDDAEISEYLNSLGEKLVAANPDPSRPFQFFAVSYCLKHCSRGPVVAVQPDNVWYAGVGEKDLPEICAHLEGGPPVERLLMPDVPWE